MATLNDYKGSVELVAGLRPISTGYPLIEAHDIQVGVGDIRLDAKLASLDSSIGSSSDAANVNGTTTWSRIKAIENRLGLSTDSSNRSGDTAWSRINKLRDDIEHIRTQVIGSTYFPSQSNPYTDNYNVNDEDRIATRLSGHDANFAEEFSTSKSYSVGDYVIYKSVLYKCKSNTTAGAWNAAKWDRVNLSNAVEDILESGLGKSTDAANASGTTVWSRIKALEAGLGASDNIANVSGTTAWSRINSIQSSLGRPTDSFTVVGGTNTADSNTTVWTKIKALEKGLGSINDLDKAADVVGTSVWSVAQYAQHMASTALEALGVTYTITPSSIGTGQTTTVSDSTVLGKSTDAANASGTSAWSRINAIQPSLGTSSDTASASGTTAWSRIKALESGLGVSSNTANASGTTAWSRINAIQSGLGKSSDEANADGTSAWSQINSLKSELQTVKTSVSNGKSAVASAITDKMVSTSDSDSFTTMATNIGKIETAPPNGKKWEIANTLSTGYTHISIIYANECFYLFSKLSSSTQLQVFINTDPYDYPIAFVDKSSSVSSNAINFVKVVYGKGMFVGYNSSSKIFYSRDALTWTEALSISNAGFYNLSFSLDRFLIYSSSGIKYSLDGITWNSGSSTYPFSSSYLLSSNIIYNGEYYMLVAANSSSTTCNALYVSRDLETWVSMALENPVGNNPVLSWNNNKLFEYNFLIIAGADHIYLVFTSYVSSSLSITYFNKQSNTWGIKPTGIIHNDTATIIYSNQSSNSKFLYNNMKRIWNNSTTVNGSSLSVETWRPYNFVNNSVISDIAYGYNIFIAIGNNGSNGVIAYSRNEQLYYDDKVWDRLTTPQYQFSLMTYFNGKLFGITNDHGWYIYNKNNNIFELVGGTDITFDTYDIHDEINTVFNNLTQNDTYIYLLYISESDNTVKISYTQDGINFSTVNVSSSTSPEEVIFIRYGNGKLILAFTLDVNSTYTTKLMCYNTSNMSSNTVSFSGSFTPLDCAYGAGKFVIIGGTSSNSTIMQPTDKAAYSTDGITWTDFTMPCEARWYNIKYGNGIFVAIGYSSENLGVIAYSYDGITFYQVDIDPSTINYFNHLDLGTMPSYDSYTWFHELSYGKGKFMMAYPYDVDYTDKNNVSHYRLLGALYSKDGKIWKPYFYENRFFWNLSSAKIVYCEGKFVLHFTRTGEKNIYISRDKND